MANAAYELKQWREAGIDAKHLIYVLFGLWVCLTLFGNTEWERVNG